MRKSLERWVIGLNGGLQGGLPDFFKQHLLKRIEERNGQYGLAWRLVRRYREGRYCLV